MALVAWTSLTLAQDGHPLSGRLRHFFKKPSAARAFFRSTHQADRPNLGGMNVPAFMGNWGFVHNAFV
jgi:hypothetical protein